MSNRPTALNEVAVTHIIAWLAADDPMEDGAVAARARLLFLDTVGCLIAGLAKPEPAALAASLGALEPGSVLLPGAKTPLSAGSAAYVAGLAACWDEACEGLPRAHGRPGLHSFAAALALGLARKHTLAETLRALVAGFEVAGWLGEYLRIVPGMHVDGTWGTFGAVAAAARLLALSPDETVAALQGAACQLPYSLYLPISQGATVRNTYVGEAARRGIACALDVQSGITAPPGAIETFDRLALGVEGADKALAPAGEWFILQGYLKPYAAVRHVHYGAQAAIDWRRSQGQPDTTKIETLELHIYGEAITYCGNRAPRTPIQAQFSLAYGLAWALCQGDLGPDLSCRQPDRRGGPPPGSLGDDRGGARIHPRQQTRRAADGRWRDIRGRCGAGRDRIAAAGGRSGGQVCPLCGARRGPGRGRGPCRGAFTGAAFHRAEGIVPLSPRIAYDPHE
ncbi:MAG: MmgE/PrpD family protein [Alphaproteobacteria bacterium]